MSAEDRADDEAAFEAFVATRSGDLFRTAVLLTRDRGLTAVVLLTLTLGIGANTIVFSLLHGVLLSPLPYPEPERLVRTIAISEKA